MTEQEIIALVAQAMAQHAPALPSWQDTLIAKGIIKGFDALLGGTMYLLSLWALSGETRVGKFLFKYSDEVALLEDQARDEDPAINIPARSALSRVFSARILGFAIVVGLILAW